MQVTWTRPECEGDSFAAAGWLRTGVVAAVDADVYLRIVDRLKDMISVGGFKVYPSVIEARLYEHPAVKEAIVLGVPDPYLGETPKAFVTLEDGLDVSDDALAAWPNPQIGQHERVSEVEVRAE